MASTALRSLLILGLVFCAAAAAQDTASVALEECAANLEKIDEHSGHEHEFGEAAGPTEISESCPELRAILENSPYAAWLPEDWWGPTLSPSSLRELGELIADVQHPAEVTWKADTSGVSAALATLGASEDDEVTWWDRVREWLRTRLQSEAEEPPNWLIEWLEKLDEHEQALRIMGYVLFGLIVLAAGLIVFNELRASGVFGTRAARIARSAAARAGAGAGHTLTLDDIERSDPWDRPSQLLALLLGVVARREDHAVDPSFTHRELASRVALANDWQRNAFGQLLRCAEQVRYAAELPARSEIDEAVTGGRRLLESMLKPAGAAAT